MRTPALATFVLLSLLVGCSSDGQGGDEFDATVDTNLDQVEIDQVAAIIGDDDVLGPLVGATPVMTNTAPWTGTRPYRLIGAVTTVAVLDGPRDVQVELPTYECLDGQLWGVVYRTEALHVPSFMVWVDLNRGEVVAAHTGGGSDIRSHERLRPTYFPDNGADCSYRD